MRFTVNRFLNEGQAGTKGMRDLLLRVSSTGTHNNRTDELCAPFDGKPRVKNTLLRYDGNRYPIPDRNAE